jgi:hypothetical protein
MTAIIRYSDASRRARELQGIESICFIPAGLSPDEGHENRLEVRNVEPVVVSEVLRLVHAILARAD